METESDPIEQAGKLAKKTRKKKTPKPLAERMETAASEVATKAVELEQITSKHGAVAKALAARRQKEQVAAKAAQGNNTVWYVTCQEPTCLGPGLWIFEEPSGALRPDQWSTTYKPLGMPWPSKDVPCQCCYDQGIENFLPMWHMKGVPAVNPRHLQKMSRQEFELLLEGGAV